MRYLFIILGETFAPRKGQQAELQGERGIMESSWLKLDGGADDRSVARSAQCMLSSRHFDSRYSSRLRLSIEKRISLQQPQMDCLQRFSV